MTTQPSVNDMMEAYALDAVDHAKHSFGVELDFSVASVERVEEILSRLHDKLPRGFFANLFSRGRSEEVLGQMVKMYGGYVGEVLRREAGGEWYFDEETTPGQRTIGLQKDTRKVWPPAKVRKRIVDGDKDDVWAYFKAVLDEKWRREKVSRV